MSDFEQGPRSQTRSSIALFAGAALLAASLACDADDPQCPTQSYYAAHVTVFNAQGANIVLESRANEQGDWLECEPDQNYNSIACGLYLFGEVTFRATADDGRQVETTESISGNLCGPSYPPANVGLELPDR